MVDHVAAYVVQDFVGVPLDPVQHPLDTVRPAMARLLGQRPAALALERGNQPPHTGKHRLPRLRAAEPVHEPPMHRLQFTRSHTHISKVPTHDHTNDDLASSHVDTVAVQATADRTATEAGATRLRPG